MREQMLALRAKYGVSQRVAAEVAGISVSTYIIIENNGGVEGSPTVNKVKENLLENEDNMRRYFIKKRREMNNRRIPNIPDFYDILNSLCDTEGKLAVDKNHPQLQELRMLVGGEKMMTSG